MTKRQAIAEVRAEANAIIEQLERRARGWDQGRWRNDMRAVERNGANTIAATLEWRAGYAFSLACSFRTY
jgi:hypothetical protein